MNVILPINIIKYYSKSLSQLFSHPKIFTQMPPLILLEPKINYFSDNRTHFNLLFLPWNTQFPHLFFPYYLLFHHLEPCVIECLIIIIGVFNLFDRLKVSVKKLIVKVNWKNRYLIKLIINYWLLIRENGLTSIRSFIKSKQNNFWLKSQLFSWLKNNLPNYIF